VVDRYVVAAELDSQPVRLLGVDPFAEPPFRSYLGPGDQANAPAGAFLADLMAVPATALISSDVAARYGLAPGDALTLRNGSEHFTLTLVPGCWRPRTT
jgi:putative ABC transport system permease protein